MIKLTVEFPDSSYGGFYIPVVSGMAEKVKKNDQHLEETEKWHDSIRERVFKIHRLISGNMYTSLEKYIRLDFVQVARGGRTVRILCTSTAVMDRIAREFEVDEDGGIEFVQLYEPKPTQC